MANLMQVTVLLILQVTLATRAAASEAVLPGFQECLFEDNAYSIGETFHPNITRNGKSYEMICSVCTCHATTLVQCKTIECPPLNCTFPIYVNGHCCEICLDDVPSVPLSPDEPADCLYNGTHYDDGDMFHPDNGNNPFCTTCQCQNGTTMCQNISDSCPLLHCLESDQVLHDGECCPICKPFPAEGPGCQDHNGFVYEEGTTFHPYFEVFGGYIDCLNCTCQDSDITCMKDPCPPVPPCTKEHQIQSITLCCPECSQGGPETPSTPSKIPTTQPTMEVTPDLMACNSEYYYKLYLCPDGRSMVINNIKNNTAQKFTWLEGGAKQFIDMSSDDFQATECSDPQYYQGSTIERRVNGLTGKADKKEKIESCTKNCALMVVNMLRPVDVPINGC